MILLNSTVLMGLLLLLLAGIGWLIRRRISGDSARETAALYQSHASIAGIMKTHNLNDEDVASVAALISTKKKQAAASSRLPSIIPEQNAANATIPGYWTQTAMNVRARAAVEVANARLAASLIELHTLLEKEQGELLDEAQNAWVGYRDLQAAFEAWPVSGGTMESLIRSTEEEEITLKRVAELDAITSRFKAAQEI